ncbi:MAG: hypothetical protein H0T51_01100 [Pirellulales bacterium]|nr:hypothetical protein [Pirellulales bacterium]
MPKQFNEPSGWHRARQAPRGVSLVEMVAVMSASTVVIGAAIVMLATIGRADRVYDRRLNQQHAVTQLADRLRTDIHAAKQATWDESKATLHLIADVDSVLAYVAEEERWVRRKFASGEQGDGELSGAYALPAGLLVKIEPAEAAPGERLRIEWTLPAAEASRGAPPMTVEVIAIVGRDERLLHE